MQVVPTPGCRPDTRCRFAAHLTNLLPRFARSIPAAGNPQQEFADERIDRRPTLGRIPPRSGQDLFVNAESDISHVTHVMCKCVNRQGDLTEMAGGDKPRWGREGTSMTARRQSCEFCPAAITETKERVT